MPKKITPPSNIVADTEAAPSNGAAGHEDVQRLAYEYWLARGCPEGSAEQDWFRAEQTLQDAPNTEQA